MTREETASADPRVDALYALPLAEFVAGRDRLAAELRKSGAAAEAAEVKRLAKPSVSAWAANQTVRRARKLIERLLAVSDALAEAQRHAGAGEDGRRRYQEAQAEQKEALAALDAEARAVLAESAHSRARAQRENPTAFPFPNSRARAQRENPTAFPFPNSRTQAQRANPTASRSDNTQSADLIERVVNNFRWGALDAEARPLLRAGRLVRDVEPPGFGALLGAAPAERVAARVAPPPPPKARAADPAERRRAEEARRERERRREAVQSELREARRETAAARKELERHERARSQRATQVETLERDLETARTELRGAEEARAEAAGALATRLAAEADLARRLDELDAEPQWSRTEK